MISKKLSQPTVFYFVQMMFDIETSWWRLIDCLFMALKVTSAPSFNNVQQVLKARWYSEFKEAIHNTVTGYLAIPYSIGWATFTEKKTGTKLLYSLNVNLFNYYVLLFNYLMRINPSPKNHISSVGCIFNFVTTLSHLCT